MNDQLPPPTAKVSAAFVKAQAEFKPAVKSAQNPHLKSRYAKLEDVISAVRESLGKHDLAFTQSSYLEDGVMTITTRLIHSSGEMLFSCMSIPVTKADSQGIGSTLSYLKRYSLSALLGVSSGDGDDDGHASSTSKDTAIAAAKIVKAKKAEASDGIL
jgi:hypothetical protein